MLREAVDADRDRVLAWRNHPRVRQTHFVQRVITEDEHDVWWGSIAPGTRVVLIYEWDGRPSGVVHFSKFDRAEGSAHWGFFLDIDALEPTGELLPAWIELEREAIDYAFDRLGLSVMRGETLTINPVVLQLNRRFGFRLNPPFTRVVDGVEHEAIMTELRVEDRRRRSKSRA